MEEYQSDLLIMKGKYSVLKQEFDRLRMDNDARIPLAVHTASVNECRKLFHDLKSEYENQKSRLIAKIKDLEENLSRQNKQEEKWAEEKNFLEKSNFNQTFEIETLMRKISELENQLSGCGKAAVSEKIKQELSGLKRQLG